MDFKNINWNTKTYNELINYLYSLKDIKYKEFNDKIVNTKLTTIGIRIPLLRKIAKEISKSDYQKLFDYIKDTNIYEVIFIKGLLITKIKDFNLFKEYLKQYLNEADNWALIDMIANSVNIKHYNKEDFLLFIKELIYSNKTFYKRMGYVILLSHFVNSESLNMIFNYIKNEKTNEYYVEMAISWLLCELYIKFEEETYEFLKNNKINNSIMKKTVSKINDSYRVSKESKAKVRLLIKSI